MNNRVPVIGLTVTAALLFILNLAVLFTLLSCPGRTLDGYYYNLEDARSAKAFYNDADSVFTNDIDGGMVDFVIKNQQFHIVEIDMRGTEENTKYRIKATRSLEIEEEISRFNQAKDYHWTETRLIPSQWCIVSKEFNDENRQFPSFDFVFQNESYSLCYQNP